MKREQYIQFRKDNSIMDILYEYALEKGFSKGPEDFYHFFMIWSSTIPPNIVNLMVERVIEDMDVKYEVVITYFKEGPEQFKLLHIQ